jgi:hypothetical protein
MFISLIHVYKRVSRGIGNQETNQRVKICKNRMYGRSHGDKEEWIYLRNICKLSIIGVMTD